MKFELKIIDNTNLGILKNLFHLYIHDISKELPWDCNEDGIFEAYSLDEWLLNTENFGYLVYVENNIAGFVMIDKEFKILPSDKTSLNLSEIFILNNYKGKGLASAVVNQVFNMHKANWEARPVPKSNSALMFWEAVFKKFKIKVTKHEWKENRFAFTFTNI